MLIFIKERLAFLSVPKTGSTAWHDALAARADLAISGPPELKHAPVYRYNRFLRPMFDKVCGVEPDLLAVMREPVSWLGSWYRYRARPQIEGQPNSTAGISFDDFVLEYCKEDPAPFARVGSQEKFLRAQPNGTAVRHLFRYEDRDALVAFLSDRLGALPDIARLNVSPTGPMTLSAPVAQKLRVRKAADFDLYDSLACRGG